MKQLILGSASPRRRELLSQIGVDFEVLVNGGEEIYTSIEPSEIVQELALEKAKNVSHAVSNLQDKIILGADTIVVRDNEILGKPASEEEAFAMIRSLAGRSHYVYTGTAFLVYDKNGDRKIITHAEKTTVHVHEMTEQEIWDYIKTKDPMDKAGAYGIQGPFAAFVDGIEGDYYNVVGLPVAYVYQTLKEL